MGFLLKEANYQPSPTRSKSNHRNQKKFGGLSAEFQTRPQRMNVDFACLASE
jgi:hypothetical protein